MLVLILPFQIICMGKYSDTREMDLLINPTIWLIHPAVIISIVLNILIYQKQRKIEREDQNQRSMFVLFHFGNFIFFPFLSRTATMQCPRRGPALSMHIVNFPSQRAPILCKHTCIH